MALSLVALVGAGLFLRSLRDAQRIDPGFDYRQRALADLVDLGAQGYDEARGARLLQPRCWSGSRRCRASSGATLASGVPLFLGGFARTVFPEGGDSRGPRERQAGAARASSARLLRDDAASALVRGRDFAVDRPGDAPRVVVVTRRWRGSSGPARRRSASASSSSARTGWNEVVGVARDGKYNFLGEEPQPHIYLALAQVFGRAVTLHVRTSGDPATALGAGAARGAGDGRLLPITDVFTLRRDPRVRRCGPPRMGAALLGGVRRCSRWCWR